MRERALGVTGAPSCTGAASRTWAPALAGAFTVAVWLFASATPRAEVIDRVLAIVSSHAVLESDIRAVRDLRLMTVTETGDPVRPILDAIIERWLMLSEVDRYVPPEPSEAAIDRALQEIRDRFSSPAPFHAVLERAGLTEAHLRGRIRDDLRIAAYLDERFTALVPTDEAIQAYLTANPDRFLVSGRTLPLDEVRDAIAREMAAADRRARVEQWIAGLKQRAQIIDRYKP